MGKTISIINQKGGVGKTTTALNLGDALHRMGYRVLAVDLDPQANLTIALGIKDCDKKKNRRRLQSMHKKINSTKVIVKN